MISSCIKIGRHHLAVEKLSVLLREITKGEGDFYCLNSLHSFATQQQI